MTFEDDLKFGQAAEDDFAVRFKLTRTDGRKGDLITSSGDVVELKTDRHDPKQTVNFIMERYSYSNRPGGPWQALQHGVKYFVYRFETTDEIFVFDVSDLCKKLEEIVAFYAVQLENKVNESHITRFYRIRRHHLKKLFLPKEVLFG